MSWLNDIKKQKSEDDKRRRDAVAVTAKRVREKAKKMNSIVMNLLKDFGKTCWGIGLLAQSYDIQAGQRGQSWVWRLEHLWDERGITNAAVIEVYLKVDPITDEFEFMLIQPEKLSDVGPRCPCNQEALKTMLRETYESWLKEARKHHLKR